MRIDAAWREWDAWCLRQRRSRSQSPKRGERVSATLEDALQAGAARLGVTATELRRQIEAERRDGRSVDSAVVTVVERLRAGGGVRPFGVL